MKFKLISLLFLTTVLNVWAGNNHPGKVQLYNGLSKTGYIQTINYDSKIINIYSEKSGKDLISSIPSDSIQRIEIYNEKSPEKTHKFEYLKIKKDKEYWLAEISQGPYVRTFIMAQGYEIDTDGSLIVLGSSTTYYSNNVPTMNIQPSYPVYMIKNGEEIATNISLHGGVKFEDSSFRGGFSRYLSDDKTICDLIRKNKLGFNDIDMINKLYDPNRGNAPLIYNNQEITIEPDHFFTNYFNRELEWKFEFDKPFDSQHGVQARIGLQSSFLKFFTYGFEVGYGSAIFADETLLPPYYEMNNTIITNEYLVKSHGMLINTFLGTHLPMDLKSFYLIPGFSVALGGLICENNSTAITFHYAPTVTLDFGFKSKYGNVIFIGTGFRHNVPIVSQEKREDQTYNGFSYYNNYNSLFFRIGYQF
jgi:hypothetical protein